MYSLLKMGVFSIASLVYYIEGIYGYIYLYLRIYALPETHSSPLKIEVWKMKHPFGMAYFQRARFVSRSIHTRLITCSEPAGFLMIYQHPSTQKNPRWSELPGCTRCACGEEFRNCADVKVKIFFPILGAIFGGRFLGGWKPPSGRLLQQ